MRSQGIKFVGARKGVVKSGLALLLAVLAVSFSAWRRSVVSSGSISETGAG
jgi:hypothetical protein